jgi:hypothetical protein
MKFFFACIFSLSILSCKEVANKPATDTLRRTDTNINTGKELVSPYAGIDISPLDIIYFPSDFPVLKMSQKAEGLPVARVIYSRPHKQGREIFGALIPYNEPWRLGANEATEIELFRPVNIQGKRVSPGKYVLYCIPREDKWTIVFNTNIYTWGLKQDATKDVFRFDILTQKATRSFEYFTMTFDKSPTGAILFMSWDNVTAQLPITIQ